MLICINFCSETSVLAELFASTGQLTALVISLQKRLNAALKVVAKNSSVSAFDNQEGYELTALGQQFVHYAMTDLPLRIEFKSEAE